VQWLYAFRDLAFEAPDLFLHLAESDPVIFKGDVNHRKLAYDYAAPADTYFSMASGPMAFTLGAPRVASLRTIKSDMVVGLPSKETADELDERGPGWKISRKYVQAVVLLSQGSRARFE